VLSTFSLYLFSAKYVPDKTFTFCGSPMLTAPEIIRCQGYNKGVDHWSWAVTVYRLMTGKYPFYEDGMDELALYKRICKGTFELNGLMSVEFRMLMVAILYPDPTQRLGSRANGWRDIFASPWFTNDPSFDLKRLRKQSFPAPWVPDLKDCLDASRFHQSSDVEDLMSGNCPEIPEEQQGIFSSFGPMLADIAVNTEYL
jgi:protein kinase A